MKKGITIYVVTLLIMLCLSGCSNTEKILEEAKTAYSSQNYERVVDLLKDEDNNDAKDLYNLASAHISYNNKNYDDVIERLNNIDSAEASEMFMSSLFQVYSAKLSDSISDLQSDSLVVLFDEIYEKLNGSKYIDQIEKTVSDLFNNKLKELKYADYEQLDHTITSVEQNENLNSTNLPTVLKSIRDDNTKNKAKAFLIQTSWVRMDGTSLMNTEIKISFGEDNIATVSKVGSQAKKIYKFKKGDIKWKSIKIIDEKTFTYEELSRNSDYNGEASYLTSKGTIDYENQRISCSVTSDNTGYSHGNSQILCTKSFAQKVNEATELKKHDFTVKFAGKDLKDANKSEDLKKAKYNYCTFLGNGTLDSFQYDYWYYNSKNNQKTDFQTQRGICYGSSLLDIYIQIMEPHIFMMQTMTKHSIVI